MSKFAPVADGEEIVVRWKPHADGVTIEALVRNDGTGIRLRKDINPSNANEVWRVLGSGRVDLETDEREYPDSECALAERAIKEAFPSAKTMNFDGGLGWVTPPELAEINAEIQRYEQVVAEMNGKIMDLRGRANGMLTGQGAVKA